MKIGLFPGRFDPLTLGHLDIMERSKALCEQLYVAVVEESADVKTAFTLKERMEMLLLATADMTHVKVVSFSGLAVACAKQWGANFLIRGVRNPLDLIFEQQMAVANRQLSGIETVLVPTSAQFTHLNGTLVREIARYGASLEGFVPPHIAPMILEKMHHSPQSQ